MTTKNTFNFKMGEDPVKVEVNLYGKLIQIKISDPGYPKGMRSATGFTTEDNIVDKVTKFLRLYLDGDLTNNVTRYIQSITNLKFKP